MALRTLSRYLSRHTCSASLCPLASISSHSHLSPGIPTARSFATSQASSSDTYKDPNWCRPKKTNLSGRDDYDRKIYYTDLENEIEGRDFEHWIVVVEEPPADLTRNEIISSYITLLAQVLGSEEEARMKIYSVATKGNFAFGALVSEEISYKLKELPGVLGMLPDAYVDKANKDYGGEPVINGVAVPYDHDYYMEWLNKRLSNNWPKQWIRDMDRWLVVLEPPLGEPTRDEIISSYITTLALVLGSEEEARMKIYSVFTRHYFAFGADLVCDDEIAFELNGLPWVRWATHDRYDVRNNKYRGEPFINGRAVPYDPKYIPRWAINNFKIPVEPPSHVMRSNHLDKYTVLERNSMNWTFNKSPQVLVPIADGIDEMEATIITNVLRQTMAEVTVASVGNKLEILASQKVKLVADILLEEAAERSYDLIVLPGGRGGAEMFANSAKLVNMLKKQTKFNRPYGAVGVSPALVLKPHGLLKGRRATRAVGIKVQNRFKSFHGVVIDGNLITCRGAGTTLEFSLAIVEKLFGRSKALELAKDMLLEN